MLRLMCKTTVVYYKSRKRELKAKLMNESVRWETKSYTAAQPLYVQPQVYFQQYKKRAKAKGNKKCHTETMRGKKSRCTTVINFFFALHKIFFSSLASALPYQYWRTNTRTKRLCHSRSARQTHASRYSASVTSCCQPHPQPYWYWGSSTAGWQPCVSSRSENGGVQPHAGTRFLWQCTVTNVLE
jgi:hypothetical protein